MRCNGMGRDGMALGCDVMRDAMFCGCDVMWLRHLVGCEVMGCDAVCVCVMCCELRKAHVTAKP